MNFDELQNQWQEQESGKPITINTEILLKEVQRNKKQFDSSVFWSDVREGGGSFVMMLVFIALAFQLEVFTLLFLAFSCLFVGCFIVIDRKIIRKKYPSSKNNVDLIRCVRISLAHVDHQIWLLKNVFWWYLLPFLLGILIFCGHILWQLRGFFNGVLFIIGYLVVVSILYYGVYYLNQHAVRKDLQPRKDELEALLESISVDSQGEAESD